jgi:hypothetical protein
MDVHYTPATKRNLHGSGKPAENDEKGDQGDKGGQQSDRQAHDIADKLLHIFRDALVRIVGRGSKTKTIVSTVRQPAADIFVRQPMAPAYLQRLVQIKRTDRYRDAKSG